MGEGKLVTCLRKDLYTARSLLGPSSVCLRKASRTETMMTVSSDSLKTTRNTGTEKTSTAIAERLEGEASARGCVKRFKIRRGRGKGKGTRKVVKVLIDRNHKSSENSLI